MKQLIAALLTKADHNSRNPIRGLAISVLTIGGLILGLLGALIGISHKVNNSEVPFPSHVEIEQSQLKAIDWIKVHESEVLDTENPVLWWMLRDSAALSGNAYLASLYAKYYERYLAHNPTNAWHHLFDQESDVWIRMYAIDQLPDYNLLFLYGLSCDPALRKESKVARLLRVDSCGSIHSLHYFRNPACATHQLMGVHFMQQRRCEDDIRTGTLIRALQDKIVVEATWDFRGVVDSYIQKILMLAESGAAERIKPIWLKRVINAQRGDGGWDDFDEIVRLDTDRSFGWSGWSAHGWMWVRHPKSNLHTTAQGLYLMSLLKSHSTGAVDHPFKVSFRKAQKTQQIKRAGSE